MNRAAGALVAALLAALIVWQLERSLPGTELRDYGSFVASGRAASQGENPYGVHPLTFRVSLPGFQVKNPNLNPPVSVLLFQLFDRVEPYKGFRWWWSVSLVAYLAGIAVLAHRYRSALPVVLWSLALAGFWDTQFLGQIYLPLVLAAIGAWLLLDAERPLAAGILLGIVVAVKPNFLVWPAVLLLAGHVRVVVATGITALALSTLPLFVHGVEIYRQWLELVLEDRHRTVFLTNASLLGLSERVGAPLAGRALSVIVLGVLAAWAWRRRPGPMSASTMGLLGSLLASPVAWVHYTLFLLPVFFARPFQPLTAIAAALLVVPAHFILRFLDTPWWVQFSVGSVYAWAVLLCLVVQLRDGRSVGRSSG